MAAPGPFAGQHEHSYHLAYWFLYHKQPAFPIIPNSYYITEHSNIVYIYLYLM